jgi:hypothetical protein
MVLFQNALRGKDILQIRELKRWLSDHVGPQNISGPQLAGAGWRFYRPTNMDQKSDFYGKPMPEWTLQIDDDTLALQYTLVWL